MCSVRLYPPGCADTSVEVPQISKCACAFDQQAEEMHTYMDDRAQ